MSDQIIVNAIFLLPISLDLFIQPFIFILKGKPEVLYRAWRSLWHSPLWLADSLTPYVRRRFLNLTRRNSKIEDGEYEMAKNPQFPDIYRRSLDQDVSLDLLSIKETDILASARLKSRSFGVFFVVVKLHSEMDQLITWQLSTLVPQISKRQAATTP